MLPFPRAHYYVAAFLLLTFVAFSQSYFLVLNEAPFAHHFHGITATLWIVLVITQSATIHHGWWKIHSWSGRFSLLLMPLFVSAGLLATQATLQRQSPFTPMFGVPLAVADVVASLIVPLMYFLALRYRKSPDHHARYMLGTVSLLIGPSVSRLLAFFVPGFRINGPDELYNFGACVDASFAFALVFMGVLLVRDAMARKPLMPFVLALIGSGGMFVGYKYLGETAVWRGMAPTLATLPSALFVIAGLLIGGLASYAGWTLKAGRDAARPAAAPRPNRA
ncbi:hypothetical protein [Parvularcula sp. LCG005]|uniref:hypothetical protein n=1 Tax=Parvularcula sp. LCG005 TaxID=3078805 RepID=UPI002942FB74|nr:hypothetical protein [Parvularcula sp. LCG005]WOI54213.1 hypothetical protein RUI03_04250 [Parvularcula sp. LCG005]